MFLSLNAAVQAGTQLLDAKVPGWAERIMLSRLDMYTNDACLLGQLYGHFNAGCSALNLSLTKKMEEPEKFGFYIYRPRNMPLETISGLYIELNRAWVEQIKKRVLVDA
jgi:hypothetical protein